MSKRNSKAGGRLRRGTYLLPSLFTIGNIILGFYAIVRGLRGDFVTAAILIFVAGVIDGLDGRIARLTNTESAFGREFDSLADVLTFGAAPALLAYVWGLEEIGRLGWILPLFYLVCASTRLARFNVQTRVADKRFFVGLPIPAAACSIASFLYFAPGAEERLWTRLVLLVAFGGLAVLMISTFRYPSFKQIDFKRRWSYRTALPLAFVLLVVAYHPPAFFLTLALVYTLSAPLAWCLGRTARITPPPEPEAKSGAQH